MSRPAWASLSAIISTPDVHPLPHISHFDNIRRSTETTAHWTSRRLVRRGHRMPTFGMSGGAIAFVDLDNDGWLDLFTVNGHVYPQVDNPSSAPAIGAEALHLNQGTVLSRHASDESGRDSRCRKSSRGLAIGDLFNDGKLDAGGRESESASR